LDFVNPKNNLKARRMARLFSYGVQNSQAEAMFVQMRDGAIPRAIRDWPLFADRRCCIAAAK
jgi:hypothetical protein